jgi:hypothetical protein
VRPAVKNESGAEADLALVEDGLMGEKSPPPQPVTSIAAGHVWRSKAALARYHIGPEWPSACGTSLIFMQDMVGMGWMPALVVPANAGTHTPRRRFFARWPMPSKTTAIGGYGSRRSPGRRGGGITPLLREPIYSALPDRALERQSRVHTHPPSRGAMRPSCA